MAIRGRRYPATSYVKPIVIARPYPPSYRRYVRPVLTTQMPRIYRSPTRAVPAGPLPPIAAPRQYVRLPQPCPVPNRQHVRSPLAGSSPTSRIVISQQARQPRTPQNMVRSTSITHSTPPPNPARAGSPVVNRPQVISPQTNRHTYPVRIVNPPVPVVVHQRFDQQRVHHLRPQFPYPNRRQP